MMRWGDDANWRVGELESYKLMKIFFCRLFEQYKNKEYIWV